MMTIDEAEGDSSWRIPDEEPLPKDSDSTI